MTYPLPLIHRSTVQHQTEPMFSWHVAFRQRSRAAETRSWPRAKCPGLHACRSASRSGRKPTLCRQIQCQWPSPDFQTAPEHRISRAIEQPLPRRFADQARQVQSGDRRPKHTYLYMGKRRQSLRPGDDDTGGNPPCTRLRKRARGSQPGGCAARWMERIKPRNNRAG